jgi:hypothetical protein
MGGEHVWPQLAGEEEWAGVAVRRMNPVVERRGYEESSSAVGTVVVVGAELLAPLTECCFGAQFDQRFASSSKRY